MKTNRLFLPILCPMLFHFCCVSPREEAFQEKTVFETDSIEMEVVADEPIETENAQVLVLEKRSVVFFMINKRELKELIRDMGETYRWETEALFTNFSNQAKNISKFIK